MHLAFPTDSTSPADTTQRKASDPVAEAFGALAAAIIFDAFVVRIVLVPALMYLLGERAWWLPGWLDRILPDVDVEGDRLLEYRRERGLTAPSEEEERELQPVG